MSMLAGKSRLVIAAAGGLIAAGYLFAARQLEMPIFSDPVGPRAVPTLIAGGLVVAALGLVLEHLVLAMRGDARLASSAEAPTGVAFVAVAMLAAYYLAFERLGFILSTMLFLIAFLSFSNRGRWATNIAVAVAFPIGAYLLLDGLFGARLPAGILAVG